MAAIKFINHDGSVKNVVANVGESIMLAAINNGIEAINASCGGLCACATCHCFIDDLWQDKVPTADDMEISMLECVPNPKANSRLSCQLVMSPALDGIVIHLPESQR